MCDFAINVHVNCTSTLIWANGSEHEVNRCISISRNCMQMLDRHIWRSMISVSTKLRLYNIYILPVFLYGAETWSITKAIQKRIDAFDQWCLRIILNITWSECVTNFEVRRRTGQPLLSDTVRIRCLKLFGHVARADKSQDHSRALQACPKELEAASRSSKTYLAKNGGGRSAPI